MSSKKSDAGTRIGRDARTGEFIPVREAIRRPATTTIETVRPGGGGAGRIGRDARTGEFIPVRDALRRPATTTIERRSGGGSKKGR
jgi:hypothetical protein